MNGDDVIGGFHARADEPAAAAQFRHGGLRCSALRTAMSIPRLCSCNVTPILPRAPPKSPHTCRPATRQAVTSMLMPAARRAGPPRRTLNSPRQLPSFVGSLCGLSRQAGDQAHRRPEDDWLPALEYPESRHGRPPECRWSDDEGSERRVE